MCGSARLLTIILLSRVSFAVADIYVQSSSYHVEPLADLEADFGPEIPDVGIDGVLKLADPLDACSPFSFTDFQTQWIALIARQQQLHASNCTFDIKVRHAQDAGAIAAIVYDDVYESLIIMSMPPGHQEPDIPAVFVTERSGFILTQLLSVEGGDLLVHITPVSTVAWLTAFLSGLLGLLVVAMGLTSFYVMRSWGLWLLGMPGTDGLAGMPGQVMVPGARPAPASGLPPSVIRSLPVIIYEQSSSHTVSRNNSMVLPTHATKQPTDGGKALPADGGPSTTTCCTGASGGEEGQWPAAVPSSSSSEHDWPHSAGLHAGETKRLCTICLEDYEEGDKVRVLPCLHRFHMQCVDQWLGSRRLCPVCKHDAGRPLVPAQVLQQQQQEQEQQEGEDGQAARRRSPLLARLWSWLGWQGPGSNPEVQPLLGQEPGEALQGGAGPGTAAAAAAGAQAVPPWASGIAAGQLPEADLEAGSLAEPLVGPLAVGGSQGQGQEPGPAAVVPALAAMEELVVQGGMPVEQGQQQQQQGRVQQQQQQQQEGLHQQQQQGSVQRQQQQDAGARPTLPVQIPHAEPLEIAGPAQPRLAAAAAAAAGEIAAGGVGGMLVPPTPPIQPPTQLGLEGRGPGQSSRASGRPGHSGRRSRR